MSVAIEHISLKNLDSSARTLTSLTLTKENRMEAILTKILAWAAAIYPAVLGSALAIFNSDVTKLTKTKMLLTFLFGANVAYFAGGAAIEYFKILPTSYIAAFILFASGFMGMGILAETMIQLPIIIASLRKKFIGE